MCCVCECYKGGIEEVEEINFIETHDSFKKQ